MPAAPVDRCTPLLKDKIRVLFRRVPKALAGDEEALHQMRVAGRRLRVALPVLARRPASARVRRALKVLRQLTRTGGAGRDLDVAVRLFEERLRDQPASPELTVLRRRLLGARRRSRGRLAEALMDLEIARLRRDLRAIVRRRADGLFAAVLRLRGTRDRTGAQALAVLQTVGTRFDPVTLHRLRRKVRRLRYTAEIGEAIKGQPSTAAAEFRRLQEALGALHDGFVLSEWFGRQAAVARVRGASALADAAAAEQARFLAASQAEHQAFLALDPAAVIDAALASLRQSRPAA